MPLIQSVYVDRPLTSTSLMYQNVSYISEKLFPIIPVENQTGIYYEYSKDMFDAAGTDVRAPSTRAQRVDYKLIKNTFGPLEDHSLELAVTNEQDANQAAPLDALTDGTITLTEKLMLYKELNAQSLLSNTAVITQNVTLSGADQFSDDTSSPIATVQTGKDVVSKAIMKSPEELTLVLSYTVYAKLINHPEIIERVKYSQLGVINQDVLRQVFQVKEVIVTNTIKKTSKEGQTDALDYVWGKDMWLMYITPRPGLRTVSGGYTLNQPSIAGPRMMEHWREQQVKSDFLRISYSYQHKIMAAAAIYYFKNAVA